MRNRRLLLLLAGLTGANSAAPAFRVLFLMAGVPLTWLAGRQVRRWDERERRRSAGRCEGPPSRAVSDCVCRGPRSPLLGSVPWGTRTGRIGMTHFSRTARIRVESELCRLRARSSATSTRPHPTPSAWSVRAADIATAPCPGFSFWSNTTRAWSPAQETWHTDCLPTSRCDRPSACVPALGPAEPPSAMRDLRKCGQRRACNDRGVAPTLRTRGPSHLDPPPQQAQPDYVDTRVVRRLRLRGGRLHRTRRSGLGWWAFIDS